MKRVRILATALAVAGLLAPVVRADVKTSQRTKVTFGGPMGGIMNRFSGQAAKEGVLSTIAVKANQRLTLSDITGELIDLTAEKVYRLDPRKKEYTVKTFAELRAEFQKQQQDAQKQAQAVNPKEKPETPESAQQYEYDVSVKETGQHKTLLGRDTHEVIMTVTRRVKGQTLEQGGGYVMTSDMWLGPKVPALDEIREFQLKYFKALYGEAFAIDMAQAAQVMAMYPAFRALAGQMQGNDAKIQGTPLATTLTFDSVKSAEQMKDQPQQSGGGGGIGGLIGRKLAPKPSTDPKTTVMTLETEYQSIDTAVSEADVAIPGGYKEKK